MTNTEQKWLREIRDNTKQLERIAKRLDAIHRQLDRLDRKDKPTISKMEQVDKDINVRSKDEPQTEKFPLHVVFEMAVDECKRKHKGCENCDMDCMWRDEQSGKE